MVKPLDRSAGIAVWWKLGRVVLVGVLAVVAVVNTSDSMAYLGPATVLLCCAILLVPSIPWYVAPIATAAAVAIWGWPMILLLAVALYDLGVRRRVGPAAGFAGAAVAGAAILPSSKFSWPQDLSSSVPVLAVAIVAGLWVGNRRHTLAALHAEVEHLETERRLGEDRARANERARIAAEMHDVLAHRLSLIALHSGVLLHKGAELPAPIPERLALVRAASTEALADLRDVLGALHGDQPTTDSPRPTMFAVSELVEDARAAGQQVHAEILRDDQLVPAAHRLAVQRLVQEGLTNARKHALGAPVSIRVDYGPAETTVEIVSSAGAPLGVADASGFGLVGLRERVVKLGGSFAAGPWDGDGWRIMARIPRSEQHRAEEHA